MPSASRTAGPERFPALMALGFLALAWVILNQFRFHLGLHAGDRSGLVFKGYLGVDLYLVISGFLLSHGWAKSEDDPTHTHRRLLWRWLSTVYPLHLVTLAAMGILLLASRLTGVAPHGVFDLRGIIANLTLLQAWGVTPTVTWNFPSWLISAQFAALLVFPGFARLASSRANPPWLVVGGAWLVFNAGFLAAGAMGVLFTDMTAQIGALQAIPAFMMGAGLYALWRERSLPAAWGARFAAAAGVWILTAALLRLSDLMIWPALPLLVYGLAEAAKADAPALAWRPLGYLGRIAISVYLVYLPADIVYFHAARAMVPAPTGALAWAIWTGVFPVILLAGVAAHHLVAAPAAAWLDRHGPFHARRGLTGRFAERLEAAARGRSAAWRGLPAS